MTKLILFFSCYCFVSFILSAANPKESRWLRVIFSLLAAIILFNIVRR
jgi:hypothetical protein